MVVDSREIPAKMEEFLTPWEQRHWGALTVDKRRHDWLAGRWAAKRALQPLLATPSGVPPLSAIAIINAPDGAPQVADHPGISLTISHAGTRAAAATARADCPIGIDIEVIAPRTPAFVGDYFTPDEQQQVHLAPGYVRDTLVNAIWSAKESALKALRVGLRVDTRAVSCRFDPFASLPKTWTPLAVELDAARLGRGLPALSGWWRTMRGYVLTLMLGRECESSQRPLGTPDLSANTPSGLPELCPPK